jgi:anti-anti-sigma regulatory factor
MLQCEDGEGSARTIVISLSGVADLADVGRLRSILEHALGDHDEVRLDLSNLRAMDSACIRELLRAQALAARDHRVFGVIAASANASRILESADARGLLLDGGVTAG